MKTWASRSYARIGEVMAGRSPALEEGWRRRSCYEPVYLTTERPDCSEFWLCTSPPFIPEVDVLIVARQFGS